ncbi:MAG: phosphatase PAP2 family protein [Candidatus Diapherotrites archaeon]|uniref:Phosphatase PAP2 family protein n=1 Tax=Candidatus Iainarchaeum sp. TaxID=3101447 RepID=A0A938YX87_9ARCH|nr:phosphatase PAP2 family protein [Candidatus Diapherotrites archaeon]
MDPISIISQADIALLQTIQTSIQPGLTEAMLALTFLGNPAFWVAVVAMVYWLGHENKSFFLMNLVMFSAVASGAMKFAFARPRPESSMFRVLAYDSIISPSFPSGHATLIAGAFSYCQGFIKRNLKILFALAVIGVAFSRLYLGMHFPSDVLAGIALGLAIGKLNLLARNRLFHKNFKPSKLEDEIALVLLLAATAIALFFLQPLPLVAALIGYYIGFFLFKEMELKQTKLSRNQMVLKQALGFAFLGAIFTGTGDILIGDAWISEIEQFFLYLIAGFWISWAWPAFVERGLGRKKN